MPSTIVTKDDVEDTLYKLGITDPRKIVIAARVIDHYSFHLARQYAAPPPAPAAPKVLQPGESDLDAKTTCCADCGKIKAWSQFPYDPKSDSKHSVTCKVCSPQTQVPRDPYLEIECTSCGEKKNADVHFRRSSSKTGYRTCCRDCECGKRKCQSCGKTRLPGYYIADSKVCVFCMAEKYVRRAGSRKKVTTA